MAFQSGCNAESWRPKISSTVGALSGNLRLGDERCDIKFHWILIPTARTFGSTGYQWDDIQPEPQSLSSSKEIQLSKLQEYWESRCNHRLSKLYSVCLAKTWVPIMASFATELVDNSDANLFAPVPHPRGRIEVPRGICKQFYNSSLARIIVLVDMLYKWIILKSVVKVGSSSFVQTLRSSGCKAQSDRKHENSRIHFSNIKGFWTTLL